MQNLHVKCVIRTSLTPRQGEALLAPVTFHQNPPAPLANPMMRYPAPMGLWRLFPAARSPGISFAIPSVVSGDPHMVTAGCRPASLNHSMRRGNAYYNIGCHSAEG